MEGSEIDQSTSDAAVRSEVFVLFGDTNAVDGEAIPPPPPLLPPLIGCCGVDCGGGLFSFSVGLVRLARLLSRRFRSPPLVLRRCEPVAVAGVGVGVEPGIKVAAAAGGAVLLVLGVAGGADGRSAPAAVDGLRPNVRSCKPSNSVSLDGLSVVVAADCDCEGVGFAICICMS